MHSGNIALAKNNVNEWTDTTEYGYSLRLLNCCVHPCISHFLRVYINLGTWPANMTPLVLEEIKNYQPSSKFTCLWKVAKFHIEFSTVKWGNFGRWGNFGQYKTFILSNIFCHLKNNLVVNMEVKGYLQSVICFKRSFIRLDPMMS